jgi:hypothetical protein
MHHDVFGSTLMISSETRTGPARLQAAWRVLKAKHQRNIKAPKRRANKGDPSPHQARPMHHEGFGSTLMTFFGHRAERVERDGEPRGGHPEDVVRVQQAAHVLHDVAHDLRDPKE